MPVPRTRSESATADGLRRWAVDALGSGEVGIQLRPGPRSSGFSCETVLFDAEWAALGRTGSSRTCRAALAARIHPTGYSLFEEHDLDRQWRLMDAVGREGKVPVPKVVGHAGEGNPYLGQPFFVMERIEGEPCADSPPYPVRGWLREAGPDRQKAVVERSIDVLARIHSIGTARLPEAVNRSVPPGIEAQVTAYRRFLDWVSAGRELACFEQAYEWLRSNLPAHDDRVLCWGDARLGNILFAADRPAAVLDWEMAGLGPPEADVAWWLAFDRIHTEGRGVPRLPGFPSEQEIVERYEKASGHAVRNLHFYLVWAGLRAAVLLFRFHDMLVRTGMAPEPERAAYQPARRVLNDLLDKETTE